jgi:hypothetical protein
MPFPKAALGNLLGLAGGLVPRGALGGALGGSIL